jgi:hypothetical protein
MILTIAVKQPLIDYSRRNPALPNGHKFSDFPSGYYWSATALDYHLGLACTSNSAPPVTMILKVMPAIFGRSADQRNNPLFFDSKTSRFDEFLR